jgi:hypothetical protein
MGRTREQRDRNVRKGGIAGPEGIVQSGRARNAIAGVHGMDGAVLASGAVPVQYQARLSSRVPAKVSGTPARAASAGSLVLRCDPSLRR